MELILWRHAEAEEGSPDDARALTKKGQKQARKMADWLNHQLPERCKIVVSPATRTRQTADALGRKYKIHPLLAPGASAQDLLDAANWPNGKEPVLIVGHQPTLGRLMALLMSGQEQDWDLRKAGACQIKAIMTPDLIVK